MDIRSTNTRRPYLYQDFVRLNLGTIDITYLYLLNVGDKCSFQEAFPLGYICIFNTFNP